MIGAQRRASALAMALNCAGVPGRTSMPKSAARFCTTALTSALFNSLFSRVTTAGQMLWQRYVGQAAS